MRSFDRGARVELVGLASKPELNGQHGIVEDYHPDKGRHQIAIDGRKARLLIAAANLKPSDAPLPEPKPTAPEMIARPPPSNMVRIPDRDDPNWDEHGVPKEITPEIMNEPTGVLRTLPGGPQLMKKLIGEHVENKEERKIKARVKKASAARVPPVVVAAMSADAEQVRECIEAGHDLEALAPKEEGGWCAVPCTAYASRGKPEAAAECLDLLLQAGASATSRIGNGSTALHVACEVACAAVAQKLLDAGADVNAAAPDGSTPLMVACRLGNLNMLPLLLAYAVALDQTQKLGGTALHVCCSSSQSECLKMLLHGRADSRVRMTAGQGDTPLVLACRDNRVGCVQELISAGADVTLVNTSGMTPLHVACEQEHPQVAQMLIDAGAPVDPEGAFADGRTRLTPLFSAARRGHENCVRVCLRAGADPCRRNGEFGPALFGAVCAGSAATLRLLLRAKADPTSGPTAEQTPLYACCHKQVHRDLDSDKADSWLVDCAKVLLGAGATPNVRTSDGRTPLHAAANLGSVGLVRLLLEYKADPTAETARGETATSLAIDRINACDDRSPAHQTITNLIREALA